MPQMRLKPLALCLLLAACAPGIDRRAYLNTLVGQPEIDAVRQLGVPGRTYDTNGHRFLAYIDQRTTYVAGGPFLFGGYYGGPFGRPGFGYAAFPQESVVRACETTLEIVDGRVANWSLRGNGCG